MKINRVRIGKYKNLINFYCEFSNSNIAAFIGDNGSGKSNLLEVITKAFSNAKNYASGKELSIIFPKSLPSIQDCYIDYEIDGIKYCLRYNTNIDEISSITMADPPGHIRETVSIIRNEKVLSKKEMDLALPKSILLYYAGETKRQKGTSEETYDSYYERILKKADSADLPYLRYMDYYSVEDLPLLLLSAAAYKCNSYIEFLKYINCDSVGNNFSIILQKPAKGKGESDTYWNATGFVKHFLNNLRKYVAKTRDSYGTKYYMFFNDVKDLRNISDNEFDLFAKLKALKHYGYLYHIGIELNRINGERFSSLRLSEGEKQLGLLMLLLSITSHHECLYLFDEFDAYLHLSWQRQFAKIITNANVIGHILFTTHSPASISGVKRENVFTISNGNSTPAKSETYNRSLDEIIEEQMLVSLRPVAFTELEKEFRNAVIHDNKDVALSKLEQIREIVGESDPFFITAHMAIKRMGEK